MNTPATQPTNVDKKLEELVARTTEFCGCDTNKDVALCVHDTEAMGEVERIALPVVAALLRARRDIGKLQDEAGSTDPGGMIPHEVAQRIRLLLADTLADTELEELLR